MSGWTEPRVETLKTLWLDGLSASQVAKALGGVTRNAVIGKVHRLGLSGRGAPTTPRVVAPRKPLRPPQSALPRPRSARSAARPAPAPLAAVKPLVCEDATMATCSVETLGPCMCKWPIGDPRSSAFGFCGATTEAGPYCAHHTAIGTRPGAAAAAKSDRRLLGYLRRTHAIAA